MPAIHVKPSGLRWYMDPMMTKSEPSALAWVMSSSLAEMPTLPSPAARTWTTAGVFGPPWPSSEVTSYSAKCPLASPRYQAAHSTSGTQLNCVPTVPAAPPPPELVLALVVALPPAVVPVVPPDVVADPASESSSSPPHAHSSKGLDRIVSPPTTRVDPRQEQATVVTLVQSGTSWVS